MYKKKSLKNCPKKMSEKMFEKKVWKMLENKSLNNF